MYGGKILKAGIEDDKRNFTRFFLIRRGKAKVLRNANKTSIAFSVKNLPGALFKALSVFALRDLSLSKIESRPLRGRPWEYVFYVDLLRGDDAGGAERAAAPAGSGGSGESIGNLPLGLTASSPEGTGHGECGRQLFC